MKNHKLLILTAIFFSYIILPLFADSTIETWNWKPDWLDNGDCGPNALYVLMNLEGKKISLQEVKKHLPFDSVKGCSLNDMKKAADELGFSVETRFVRPGDISKIPRPFILHGITSQEKNLGHFIVVADFDKKKRNFALIDPIHETYTWNPEKSLLHNYSGYVILPKYTESQRWNRVASISLFLCGLSILGMVLFYRYHKHS